MTNRINALVVVLEKDIREDDIEHLKNAILMFKDVLSVKQNVSQISDHVAEMRAKQKFNDKIFKLLEDK